MSDPFKFDKQVYRDRRNKGFRGQIAGTAKRRKEEQRKLDGIARKLWLEKQKHKDDAQEAKEVVS